MPAMTSIESTTCIPKEDNLLPVDSMADDTMDSSASPSDVLSHALDIFEISCTNEKQPTSTASGRPRRSAPPITARRTGPINAANATSSFPAKVVAQHHASISKCSTGVQIIGPHPIPNQTRPKLVRLNSTDSCSTTTTASTSASLVSSTVSSPSNSPKSSPKRSIFKAYWVRNGTPRKNGETHNNMMGFSNVPRDASPSEEEDSQQCQDEDQEPSTFHGDTAATTNKSATSGDQPSTCAPRSATATLPEGHQLTDTSGTGANTATASPMRSIFGDRAMETAQRSSLPDLPSIAATLITASDYSASSTSSTYTDYHRVHHVRKTSSTGHLVKVRKSCLRRVSLYSSTSGATGREMRKSASVISTSTATTAAATETQPVVQFDPQVKVYEFQRTAFEDSTHHHRHHHHASSNDWSHLFA